MKTNTVQSVPYVDWPGTLPDNEYLNRICAPFYSGRMCIVYFIYAPHTPTPDMHLAASHGIFRSLINRNKAIKKELDSTYTTQTSNTAFKQGLLFVIGCPFSLQFSSLGNKSDDGKKPNDSHVIFTTKKVYFLVCLCYHFSRCLT